MKVMVVDSGIGGLAVFAQTEAGLANLGISGVDLIFANASPEDDYGYNSMPTHVEKIETFDRFLSNACGRFHPDLIYLACNTLTILYPQTRFAENPIVPVLDIIATGTHHLLDLLSGGDEALALFATPVTLSQGGLQRVWEEKGIASKRIFCIPCPGLADSIAADPIGDKTRELLGRLIDEAVSNFGLKGKKVFAYLGCTHYGYRRELFHYLLEEQGCHPVILNPNEFAFQDLIPFLDESSSLKVSKGPNLSFIARYRIPSETIVALSNYLEPISKPTVRGLQEFQFAPDFF